MWCQPASIPMPAAVSPTKQKETPMPNTKSKAKLGKPFEDDGVFLIDKGDRQDGRKRALLFRTHDNFVGYSPHFHRKEAYEAAMANRTRAKFAAAKTSSA